MAEWSFLTNHARVLLCIVQNPQVRLRDIAAVVDITERSAYAIATELAEAGYLIENKDRRRNHYEIQGHLPLRGTIGRERTISEVLGRPRQSHGAPMWPACARGRVHPACRLPERGGPGARARFEGGIRQLQSAYRCSCGAFGQMSSAPGTLRLRLRDSNQASWPRCGLGTLAATASSCCVGR
jgi:hypothetical protein